MKKRVAILLITYLLINTSFSQETTVTNIEQQLENLTDVEQAETEDDNFLQQLQHFIKHPLNLNTADENDLKELRMLSGLQMANFFSYRNLLGNFISIYELQAIPAWDLITIKKILPFITTNEDKTLKELFREKLKGGEHVLFARVSQILERSKGFDYTTSGTKYLGGRQKLFFRYRYQYKNLLQYGLVGDKDAGEQFIKGAQNKGFDFYSFHLFARKIGIVQSLAIGDFTVNMGQGLIQWQSLAFRKSVDVLGIKRQSAVLRPYNSAGEFNFHRGAGITIQKRNIEATAFISFRKLSANFVADTISNEDFVSSFLTSGYHRTTSEIADRHILSQMAYGGNIRMKKDNWHIGISNINYNFSIPVQKRNEPYNLFAISGKNWSNSSLDYSYTYRNFHVFGEAAIDKNFNKAFLNGMLISVDPRVDLSLMHRSINKAYQSINGNAFTENTFPNNENGLYAGMSIRPADVWRMDAYVDLFSFPWLKYLVDAPSKGKDFLIQFTYTPNKQVELYTRFRNETKQTNQSENTTVTNFLITVPRQNWRTQLSYKLNPDLSIRSRVELLRYNKKNTGFENGFMTYFDVFYKPVFKPYAFNIRLQYFETDGYNSRIYAYENDVLYYFSIPVFYEKGFRYYLNANIDLTERISCWMKISQSIFSEKNNIGTGLDEIEGNKKTEIRFQLRLIL